MRPPLLRSALLTLAAVGLMAAPAQAVKAGSVTRTSGGVRATLSWKSSPDFFAHQPHISIVRNGRRLLSEGVASRCRGCAMLGGPRQSLHVRDLDGDGEPEVVVDTFSGGAHCCSTAVIYYLKSPGAKVYAARVHDFGDSGYRLRDLNGDGVPEVVSDDDRFAYAFAAYAFSYRPPRIYDFVGRHLVDRTRSFPAVVRADIAEIDKELPADRSDKGDLRGIIAARMADLELLGRGDEVGPYLDAALRRGDLAGDSGWPRGAKYKPALLAFLRKHGYITG